MALLSKYLSWRKKIAFIVSCDSKGPTAKFICPPENIYLVLRSQVMLKKVF
jgi:hypothetical protein